MARDDEIDEKKRQFLIRTTLAMSAVGVIAAGFPFIAALSPSAKTKEQGAPVRVRIDGMKPGDQLTVMWRGKPVWIIYRTDEMLQSLAHDHSLLRDPSSTVDQQPVYAKNEYRSRKPQYLVLIGICTHLGCIPTYRPEPKTISSDWPGGFFCSCHGSKFDLAGRVFKGVPAPINLEVPPYAFLNEHEILIGASKV